VLVYGDLRKRADPAQCVREINRRLEAVSSLAPGLDRHASLVGALVDAGQLLQGIADDAFAAARCDGLPDRELARDLLTIARAVCRSWDSNFTELGDLPRLQMGSGWPAQVELRIPEGFAFYALYAEAYIEAARRLDLSAPPRVIGIRSIGTSLASAVAAALSAEPPATVRPFGDPFAREIAVEAELERALLDGDAHFVIVDEGPGQSGSSFSAVADWLQQRGVPLERIAILPSHSGAPGHAATEERRRWWRTAQREVADFEDRWPALVERWCATLLGPLDGPPEDISGGAWRRLHYRREEDWRAVIPSWERRKLLVRARGEPFLVKFAGVGSIGERKLAMARSLHIDGLVPEPVGLVHGFLVERWLDEAVPLKPSDAPVRHIGRYVAERAKLMPATSDSGASVEQLLGMARRNIGLEFGNDAACVLGSWEGRAPALERRVVRVRTDNRFAPHEWLRSRSGALIKTDALDHHQAHDLIGCQDVAWDVAGAIVEFDLNQNLTAELIDTVEEAGCTVDPQLLEFYRLAYLAFRLGQQRLGATMVSDEREQQRLTSCGDGYAAQLQLLLQPATRPDSWVG
jgi:hypothetical protein